MFVKGIVPWNKGTKGLIKPNSGSFKPLPIGSIRKFRIFDGRKQTYIRTEIGWKYLGIEAKIPGPVGMKSYRYYPRKKFRIGTRRIHRLNINKKAQRVKTKNGWRTIPGTIQYENGFISRRKSSKIYAIGTIRFYKTKDGSINKRKKTENGWKGLYA